MTTFRGAFNLDQAIFIDTKMVGVTTTINYKYYYKNSFTNALYLSPYIRYQNIEFDGNGDRISQRRIGGGADIGKEFYLLPWFILDINLGINFIPTGYEVLETDGILDIEIPKTLYGFGPRIGIAVGIQF